MKLARTADGALVRFEGEHVHELAFDGDVADLIRSGRDPSQLATRGERPADTELAAPLRPGKIVAIGLNYLDHIRETGTERPERPPIFAKWVSSLTGPTADIVVDRTLTDAVDFEVELAVVIGTRMRRVDAGDALSHVFGYTVANDVSARDIQVREPTWVRAKSLDTFCPLGPWVVTAEEVPDPQALRLWTRVNGELLQDSTTSEMVFGVASLLSICSASFPLDPGDVVLTGTPHGVGFVRDPQILLRDGDLVEAGVDGIGVLANRVRDLA